MIYLYLFGTCFHFIYVFMIIGKVTADAQPLPRKKEFFHRVFMKKVQVTKKRSQ